MKKFLLVLIFLLTITSCDLTYNDDVVLPDLTGYTQKEITSELKRLKLKFQFSIEPRIYSNDEEWDQFIFYGDDYEAGMIVKKGDFIRIYTTALALDLDRLDEVLLETDYRGKSFIKDGIGQVIYEWPVDGDTAYFYDPLNADSFFSVRFLGVDTPEVGRNPQPWAYEASEYTKNALQNATTIVLEAEGNRKDIYNRYLAWVWIDGKLHNLDLVQQAYSRAKISSSSKYYQIFLEIEREITKTGRRVHGEIDPRIN